MDLSKHDGKRVSVVTKHGEIERRLTGKLRSFQTEARYDTLTGKQVQVPEERWELVNVTEERDHHLDDRGQPGYEPNQRTQKYEAVGIDPANIVSVDTLN